MSALKTAISLATRPVTTIYPKLWFDVPELARFMTSAGIGNILFFYIDIVLYDLVIYPLSLHLNNLRYDSKGMAKFLPSKFMFHKNKESISFFVSYLIQIVFQHVLNAFLVHGLETVSTREKYLSTLGYTYSSYFVSLIGSTICNILLLRQGIPKNFAFWGTVLCFGMFNFVMLKHLVGSGSATKKNDDNIEIKNRSSKSNENLSLRNKNARQNKNTNNNNVRATNTRTQARRRNGRDSDSMRKIRGGAFHPSCGISQEERMKSSFSRSSFMQELSPCTETIVSFLFGLISYQSDDLSSMIKSMGQSIDV